MSPRGVITCAVIYAQMSLSFKGVVKLYFNIGMAILVLGLVHKMAQRKHPQFSETHDV